MSKINGAGASNKSPEFIQVFSDLKFPNISKFMPELKIVENVNFSHVVNASDLEAFLAKGVEVFGESNGRAGLTVFKTEYDTHSGLLIGYQPIESSEPVKVEELIKKLEDCVTLNIVEGKFKENTLDLISRIKRNGVVK